MKYLLLFLLMISFVSAVDIDFDCPDEIFVDEEFECSLEVFDGDGVYDVKVELDEERDSVLKIWDEDEDEWKSGYYYLKEFVESGDEEDVLLKVSDDGNFDGFVKLRQGDKREFFEIEIEVEEAEEEEVGVLEEVVEIEEYDEVIVLKKSWEPEVVDFGGESKDEVVVFESRDSKALDYLPYVFSLFMIFVVAVLIWGKG